MSKEEEEGRIAFPGKFERGAGYYDKESLEMFVPRFGEEDKSGAERRRVAWKGYLSGVARLRTVKRSTVTPLVAGGCRKRWLEGERERDIGCAQNSTDSEFPDNLDSLLSAFFFHILRLVFTSDTHLLN